MKNNNSEKLNKTLDKTNKYMQVLFILVVLFWIVAILIVLKYC